jgi:hypothetical protein
MLKALELDADKGSKKRKTGKRARPEPEGVGDLAGLFDVDVPSSSAPRPTVVRQADVLNPASSHASEDDQADDMLSFLNELGAGSEAADASGEHGQSAPSADSNLSGSDLDEFL